MTMRLVVLHTLITSLRIEVEGERGQLILDSCVAACCCRTWNEGSKRNQFLQATPRTATASTACCHCRLCHTAKCLWFTPLEQLLPALKIQCEFYWWFIDKTNVVEWKPTRLMRECGGGGDGGDDFDGNEKSTYGTLFGAQNNGPHGGDNQNIPPGGARYTRFSRWRDHCSFPKVHRTQTD